VRVARLVCTMMQGFQFAPCRRPGADGRDKNKRASVIQEPLHMAKAKKAAKKVTKKAPAKKTAVKKAPAAKKAPAVKKVAKAPKKKCGPCK